MAPVRLRPRGTALRRWRLPVASGRDLLLPRRRFRQGRLARRCRGVLETCRHLNLPAALERSRSGRGAHVWFFFEEAIPAALARRLGSHVLTETMERRPDIGLDSYRPAVSQSRHDAARRIRKLDCSAAPEGSAQTGQHRLSWMPRLFRGPTSGRFSRAFARSRDHTLNRSSRTRNDEGASSAYGCHHRTMEKSLGPHLRHVEERLRSSGICQRHWKSSLAIRSISPSKI